MPTRPPHDGGAGNFEDPIEELLAPLTELPANPERDQAFEQLCADHPDLSAELRQRWSLWLRLSTTTHSTDATTTHFGDYELLRPLGSGGMGVVWLARLSKGGIERTVALKMIRNRGLFSAETRERFRREAQAALRVEHPGLCPVYDVGEVDGTPFIAMRNVPGRTLAEHLADARERGEPLELPQSESSSSGDTSGTSHHSTGRVGSRRRTELILRYVEAAARALHVAHEAGLVHRDIKPGNLMVTPSGDPVVLDFGLARDATDDVKSLTITGNPVGTPAYMSPEQISARGRGVDRSTDVYALGATLFECLTLSPPFHAETRDGLYLKILQDPTPRLRRIDRSAPRDLDVVLETALRKEPERRYATALDFAEDLRRVRTLQPILARSAGPLERAGLWVRRNPVVSTFVVVLLVFQALLLWQVRETSRSIDRERLARKEAQRESDAARTARARAERETELKERALQRAEDNLTEAREAVEELVTTARDRLLDVPGVQSVRRELLESALEFHVTMLQREGDDPGVLEDVAIGAIASGELQLELGRLDEAMSSLHKGVNWIRKQLADHENPRQMMVLANGLNALARLDLVQGRSQDGLVLAREAATVRRRSQVLDPHPLRCAGLSNDLRLLANLQNQSGDPDGALESAHEALEVIRGQATEGLNDRARDSVLSAVAASWTKLGQFQRDRGEVQTAADSLAHAISIYRNLSLGSDAYRGHRNGLSIQLLAQAKLLTSIDRQDDAREALLEAIDVTGRLVSEFPANSNYVINLATAYNNLYSVERKLGNLEAAEAALLTSKSKLDRLVANSGSRPHPGLALALARTDYSLGNFAAAMGEHRQALSHYEDAVAILERYEADSDSYDFDRMLVMALQNRAVALAMLGEASAADESFERALERTEALAAGRPNDINVARDLCRLLHNTAIRMIERGEDERAIARLERAVARRVELADRNPKQSRFEIDVFASALLLCEALWNTSQRSAAITQAEAIGTRYNSQSEARRKAVMRSARARSDLASMLALQAHAELETDTPQLDGCRILLESAARLLKPVVSRDNTTPGQRARYAFVHAKLARIAAESDEAEARQHFAAGIDALRTIGPDETTDYLTRVRLRNAVAALGDLPSSLWTEAPDALEVLGRWR